MPRPRKLRKDLPPRLYFEDGIYFFRPKSGKRITFGSDERVARAEYWKLVGRHTDKRALGPIMDAWLEEHAADIRPRTFDDYKACVANLKAAFGHMHPDDVETADLYDYDRARHVRRARRELAVLGAVYRYAIKIRATRQNPCRDLERAPRRKKRTRCPEESEVDAFAAHCLEKYSDQMMGLYLRLKILVGLRLGDMLSLNSFMVKESSLDVPNSKTGKVQQFLFVDRNGESTGLNELIDEILAHRPSHRTAALFRKRNGETYSVQGFKANWQRRMRSYEAAGGLRFWEHDVRALAGTRVREAMGNDAAQKVLAHSDPKQTMNYTDRRMKVKVTPLKRRT